MEDLWAFNEEVLVRAVYDSELPTISAVGHEIDVTLCDLAASRRALTPSEAAEIVSPSTVDMKTRLVQMGERLHFAMETRLERQARALEHLETLPVFRFPYRIWAREVQRADRLEISLRQAFERFLERTSQRLAKNAAKLQALSPLSVLARGYSLTKLEVSGQVVRDVVECAIGERLVTQFQQGSVISRVEEKNGVPPR